MAGSNNIIGQDNAIGAETSDIDSEFLEIKKVFESKQRFYAYLSTNFPSIYKDTSNKALLSKKNSWSVISTLIFEGNVWVCVRRSATS